MQLTELAKKILADRYYKKATRKPQVGDTIVGITEDGKREVGIVTHINGSKIKFRNEEKEVEIPILQVEVLDEKTPEQMWQRVARNIASVEKNELQQKWQQKFEWLMTDWKFVPGGRILAGAGVEDKLTQYNCYVLPNAHDSRDGIMASITHMINIMSRGGGVGINLSSIRPRYSPVRGVNGRSSGAVSWGAAYSFFTGLIEQAGSRRGALMLILDDWHPDILEFISSKTKMGEITNANISVNISDSFMKAKDNNEMWQLKFPKTNHPNYETEWNGDIEEWEKKYPDAVDFYGNPVPAKKIWDKIIESAWASGEPGLWFGERSKQWSNSWYYPEGKLVATNPCAEQPLAAWAVCLLGSINLSRFYNEKTEQIEWDLLKETVQIAVRFMDNVVDATPYFFKQNEDQQKNERRIGLGTMGIAELMLKMGVRYGSDEAVSFVEEIYTVIAHEAYRASIELAKEKGPFPWCIPEKHIQSQYIQTLPKDIQEGIKKHGIRNVTVLTQAPTGSTGTMMNTSTGIEPFFSWVHYRQSRLGLHEETAGIVKWWLDKNPGKTEDDLPEYFVCAMDGSITPEDHVKMQATFQKYVDSAISKTANMPNSATIKDVGSLYQHMYDLGCKGGTIYRDGSRNEQVLKTNESEANYLSSLPLNDLKTTLREREIPETIIAAIEKRELKNQESIPQQSIEKRPKTLTGETTAVRTGFGTAYITINKNEFHEPMEVFITAPGKAGSDLQADSEGLGRLISLLLRTSNDKTKTIQNIVDQLSDIKGTSRFGLGANQINSLPDAIAKTLANGLTQKSPATKPNSDICPACKEVAFVREEGCKNCQSCGYTICS